MHTENPEKWTHHHVFDGGNTLRAARQYAKDSRLPGLPRFVAKS